MVLTESGDLKVGVERITGVGGDIGGEVLSFSSAPVADARAEQQPKKEESADTQEDVHIVFPGLDEEPRPWEKLSWDSLSYESVETPPVRDMTVVMDGATYLSCSGLGRGDVEAHSICCLGSDSAVPLSRGYAEVSPSRPFLQSTPCFR